MLNVIIFSKQDSVGTSTGGVKVQGDKVTVIEGGQTVVQGQRSDTKQPDRVWLVAAGPEWGAHEYM